MEFLSKVFAFFQILRPKNLILIAITMGVLQYAVIVPLLHEEPPVLNQINFILLVVVAMIVAGTGNLVNDIFDRKADAVNKPAKSFIPNPIPVKQAWLYYAAMLGIGLVISVFVALEISQLKSLWLYPFVCGSLFLYSKTWKSSLLWGNVVVSLFVALVWGILFYAQFAGDHINLLPGSTHPSFPVLKELCLVYASFAFLINLLREVIKDLEDVEGDRMANIKTIATLRGIDTSKLFIKILVLILILSIGTWLFVSPLTGGFEIRFYYMVFIIAPLVHVFSRVHVARQKNEYTFASKVVKLVMLFALAGLILITNNFQSS